MWLSKNCVPIKEEKKNWSSVCVCRSFVCSGTLFFSSLLLLCCCEVKQRQLQLLCSALGPKPVTWFHFQDGVYEFGVPNQLCLVVSVVDPNVTPDSKNSLSLSNVHTHSVALCVYLYRNRFRSISLGSTVCLSIQKINWSCFDFFPIKKYCEVYLNFMALSADCKLCAHLC